MSPAGHIAIAQTVQQACPEVRSMLDDLRPSDIQGMPLAIGQRHRYATASLLAPSGRALRRLIAKAARKK